MKHLDKIKKALPEQFAQHTQGEWYIDDSEIRALSKPGFSELVCEMPIRSDDAGEIKLNAKLIAAAPDLLKALQSFVDYLDSNLSEAEIILKEKAIEAIKKATT